MPCIVVNACNAFSGAVLIMKCDSLVAVVVSLNCLQVPLNILRGQMREKKETTVY